MREAGNLVIAKDKDHPLYLLKEGEKVGLYRVVFPVGIFVIAEDGERAINQAECILDHGSTIGHRSTTPTAERIPCGIQGWSEQTF